MRLNKLIRKIHHWTTVFIAIPLLIIICSGVLLQVKKQTVWIQPMEVRGSSKVPKVEFAEILARASQNTELGISGWDDISKLDVRPSKGLVKVLLENGFEVQIDIGTGEILQTAYRRSDLIESIHDGSFFGGDLVKLGLFLPAGIALFLMWLTGLWLFALPYLPSKRRKRAANKRD
jgi:uncharacterized iron-regulated membrane protein